MSFTIKTHWSPTAPPTSIYIYPALSTSTWHWRGADPIYLPAARHYNLWRTSETLKLNLRNENISLNKNIMGSAMKERSDAFVEARVEKCRNDLRI